MFLKAETMLFCMVSSINEACCTANVRWPGKCRVCVVGLYHGSQQQTTSTTPDGSLRQRPLQLLSHPSIASTSSSNESYWSWLSNGGPRSAIAKGGGLRFGPGLRGLLAASTKKLVYKNVDKSKDNINIKPSELVVLFISVLRLTMMRRSRGRRR